MLSIKQIEIKEIKEIFKIFKVGLYWKAVNVKHLTC